MANTQEQKAHDGKELVILVGFLLALFGGVTAAYWIGTGGEEARAGVVGKPVETTRVVHADVYFDFKSTRLRADAVGILQDKAELVKGGGPWVLLVHGYADRNGPPEYNRALAQRRAQAVKQFLVELGVPETSIRMTTIGQDGSLCDDPSKECQQLNRRVHLEIRQLPAGAGGPVRAVVTEGDEILTDLGRTPAERR